MHRTMLACSWCTKVYYNLNNGCECESREKQDLMGKQMLYNIPFVIEGQCLH